MCTFSGLCCLSQDFPGTCSFCEISADQWWILSGTKECLFRNCFVLMSWKPSTVRWRFLPPHLSWITLVSALQLLLFTRLFNTNMKLFPVSATWCKALAYDCASGTAEIFGLSANQSWHQRPSLKCFFVSVVLRLLALCQEMKLLLNQGVSHATAHMCHHVTAHISPPPFFVWDHNTGLKVPVQCQVDPWCLVPSLQSSWGTETSVVRSNFLCCQNVIFWYITFPVT